MSAIILGGVELNKHMVRTDTMVSSQRVAQTFKRTLGGKPVLLSAPLTGVEFITLEANETQGWLTKLQVDAVQSMASQSGAVFLLAIGNTSYSVMFRHFDDPAFAAEQFDQIGALAPDGYFLATIKLMAVE